MIAIVFKRGFALIRRSTPFLLSIILIAAALSLVTEQLQASYESTGERVFFILALGASLIDFFLGLLVTLGFAALARNRAMTAPQIMTQGLRRFFPLVLLCLQLTIWTLVRTLLLIVPGAIYIADRAAAPFLALVDEKPIASAIESSKNLTAGRRWQVLGWVMAYFAFFIVMEVIPSVALKGADPTVRTMGSFVSDVLVTLVADPLAVVFFLFLQENPAPRAKAAI